MFSNSRNLSVLLVCSFISYCTATPKRSVFHEPGWTGSLSAGATDYSGIQGIPRNDTIGPLLEVQGSYGLKNRPLQLGFLTPSNLIFSQADVYYAWLQRKNTGLGSGVLLGLVPGFYGLSGLRFAERHEAGIGIEVLAPAAFLGSENIAPFSSRIWFQYWNHIAQGSSYGLQVSHGATMAGDCRLRTGACDNSILEQQVQNATSVSVVFRYSWNQAYPQKSQDGT